MLRTSLDRAREMWECLAGVPARFPARGEVNVLVSPGSGLCPPLWTGIVALDNAILATVPDEAFLEQVRAVLFDLLAAERLDFARLPDEMPALEVRGPATLAYLEAGDFTALHLDAEVERLPADHQDVRALMATVADLDAEESGLENISSEAFVIRSGQKVAAAAGFRVWVNKAAQLSVLTGQDHRGRGLARRVASAAVADALGQRLLPQWRARPEPSRRVARHLGFRELGAQISIKLD